MFLGLRTVIYPALELDAAKGFFSSLLGEEPYFDEPFYVGFNVQGYELGLDPDAELSTGAITYWGVGDADVGLTWLLDAGARPHSDVRDVGDGIRVATVVVPGGTILGIIENPHFVATQTRGEGPGR